jgi:hypothetical protein
VILNILLLSYHFYNHAAEGQATAKLVKAFVDHGHRVTVLASDTTLVGLEDDSILGCDNDNFCIHRVGIQNELGPGMWRILETKSSKRNVFARLTAIPNLLYGYSILDWIWIAKVTEYLERIVIENGSYDILHTRMNPPINHFVALRLKKKLRNLAWCAYFSDPWPFHLYPKPYLSSAGRLLRLRLEMKLNQILINASTLIFPSKYLIDHMLMGSREKYKHKSYYAPHIGNTWNYVNPPKQNQILSIRHAGFLMKERKVEPLYDGLRKFLMLYPGAKSNLRIEFVGRFHDEPEPPNDLRGVVRFHEFINPDKIWNWLQDGDVFLLVEANLKKGIFFPSKLADYLTGRRYILALSPKEGIAADFLAQGGGIVVAPEDVDGIAHALSEVYQAWKKGVLGNQVPPEEVRNVVSADAVVPIYEQAFEQAIATRENENHIEETSTNL